MIHPECDSEDAGRRSRQVDWQTVTLVGGKIHCAFCSSGVGSGEYKELAEYYSKCGMFLSAFCL